MANLKNITELPMAESADGLNLIVNDNGAAKQMPASAVSVQADWDQNDPTKSDYVKNRPFYEAEDGEVHKIPEKYLPDGIGGSSEGWDAVILVDWNVTDVSTSHTPTIESGEFENIINKLDSNEFPRIKVRVNHNPYGTIAYSSFYEVCGIICGNADGEWGVYWKHLEDDADDTKCKIIFDKSGFVGYGCNCGTGWNKTYFD